MASDPPCRDTPDISCLRVFLSHGRRFHNPFFIFLTLKLEPITWQTCQIMLLGVSGSFSPHSNAFSSHFCFWCLPSGIKLFLNYFLQDGNLAGLGVALRSLFPLFNLTLRIFQNFISLTTALDFNMTIPGAPLILRLKFYIFPCSSYSFLW